MTRKLSYPLILLLLMVVGVSTVKSQSVFSIKSIKASISGTSTFHDWKSSITKTECTCYFKNSELSVTTIRDLQVKIPVEGIKSTEGKIMDTKTYEAFKYESNPYITFSANESQFDASQAGVVTITGNLTMAGISHPVTLIARLKTLPNGDVEVSVLKKIKMTEFNIKPPTAVLGTITVGDEVTVSFDLIMASAK